MRTIKNLVGQKYNKLMVVERLPVEGSRCKYLCVCDCGNEIITTARRLQVGKIDCGCGIKNRTVAAGIKRRKNFGEALKNRLIASYKSNAKKKGRDFLLTEKECLDLFSCNCYYCGSPPNQKFSHKKLYGEFIYNGIDRLNNSLGYVADNVVSCCTICNYKKRETDVEPFLEWIEKVYKNRFAIKI